MLQGIAGDGRYLDQGEGAMEDGSGQLIISCQDWRYYDEMKYCQMFLLGLR